MQSFDFVGKLAQRVSSRLQHPVTREQITDALVKVLMFVLLAFCAFLFVGVFVFVVVTENNFAV